MAGRWNRERVGGGGEPHALHALPWPGAGMLIDRTIAHFGHRQAERTGLAPRVRRVQNNTLCNASGQELICPDTDLMRQLSRESGAMIWAFYPLNFAAGVGAQLPLRSMRGEEYQKAAVRLLYRQIYLTFPGRRLAIQSVPVSVNGPRSEVSLFGSRREVPDIVEVATKGRANDKESMDMVRLNQSGTIVENGRRRLELITELAYEIANRNAGPKPRDGDLAIFPAVLIYDESHLAFHDAVEGQVESSSNIPLGAYIVSYPTI